MTTSISIVIPAKNEKTNIIVVLRKIAQYVKNDFECLIVVDDLFDETINAVNSFLETDKRFKIIINNLGHSPAYAIRSGIAHANSEILIITMADGSDDPALIDKLAELIERGVSVACASRYVSGGQQVGAKGMKSILSRLAGLLLFWFARVGTRDATNSFKAYSKQFIEKVSIESKFGFELGIELIAKARRNRVLVAELPTIWIERSEGSSNFKLIKWLPKYLYWFIFAFIGKPVKNNMKRK
jgi:glycosyltransferase involved in cell wall biosynthesis